MWGSTDAENTDILYDVRPCIASAFDWFDSERLWDIIIMRQYKELLTNTNIVGFNFDFIVLNA